MDPFLGPSMGPFLGLFVFGFILGSFLLSFGGLLELMLGSVLVSILGVFWGLAGLSASPGAHFGPLRADFLEAPGDDVYLALERA